MEPGAFRGIELTETGCTFCKEKINSIIVPGIYKVI
jgi:hypothetical protein